MEEETKKLINIIKRQTDYTEETIIDKLKQHKNNIENVILEYNCIGVSGNESNNKTTTNQNIFKAIRDNMNEINMKSKK